MNVAALTIVMAAYSNGRVAAIIVKVLYRMLTLRHSRAAS